MWIDIRDRFKPYSHLPKTEVLVPGRAVTAHVFPARVELYSASELLASWTWQVAGPVLDWTVVQDLERGRIEVSGKDKNGFFRYYLNHDLSLTIDRGSLEPEEEVSLKPDGVAAFFIPPKERLSFGCYQTQDVERLRQNTNMSLILPLWFHLGQWMKPFFAPECQEDTLCGVCQTMILERKKEEVFSLLAQIWQAGFHSLFSPRKKDLNFQGFALDPTHDAWSLPFWGTKWIKEILIQSTKGTLELLPLLPKELPAGRMNQVELFDGNLHSDFEWRKEMPRRVLLKPSVQMTFNLKFPHFVDRCRLRTSIQDHQGKKVLNGDSISLEPNHIYFLDHFEK